MKLKEGSERADLKLNIQKTKIMASSSITSWQINGEKVERVAEFILGGSKITVVGDCSNEIKSHLPTKVCLVKAMVFPVVLYKCESWAIKQAEQQRINAFKSWCWRKLLRVPWTASRSNQSILKEINPEYSLAGLMLKLQSFGHLMSRANSLEKTLMLGKIEGRRRGRQRMRWLDSITNIGWMRVSPGRQ